MRDTPHRTITELEDRLRRANEVIESSSPSYTLAELEQLAQRYTREYQMSIDDELGEFLQLSRFIAWLAKKEREANERGT